jgi:AcrR family transcriptional regulator
MPDHSTEIIRYFLLNEYKFIYLCFVKPRDDKKIATIYEVTPKLVIKKGLSGITMSDIAREAKMAIGTLYIYFKNKEELISEVFTYCRKTSLAVYLEGYEEKKPYKAGFKKVWMNILRYRIEHFEEAIFVEQCFHSPFITQSVKQLSQQQIKPMYGLIERGKEEKLIKDYDSFWLLVFMIGGITELIKYGKYMERPLNSETIDAAFEMCWDGLKK